MGNRMLTNPYFIYGDTSISGTAIIITDMTTNQCICNETDVNGKYIANIQNIATEGGNISIKGYKDYMYGCDEFILDTSQLFKNVDIILDNQMIVSDTEEVNVVI